MPGREVRWTANALAVVQWQAFCDSQATTVPQSFAEAFTTRDAEFIAAANPATIIELLDDLEAAHTELTAYKLLGVIDPDEAAEHVAKERDEALSKLAIVSGERDALSAKLHTLTEGVQQLSRERAELISDLVVADKRALELTETIAKLGEAIGAQGKLIEDLKAARDELADLADAHIFSPTAGNTAAAAVTDPAFKMLPTAAWRPEGPYEHPFTCDPSFAAAQPFNNVAAVAPTIGQSAVVTIDTSKPYRDKARVAELRKVGG